MAVVVIIESITANQDSFRPVELEPGMNIVLADRTKESTRTQSRNGLGKSTLVEIINFVLGANLGREQNISRLKGTSWDFTLRLNFDGVVLTATRAMSQTGEVHINGNPGTLGLQVDHEAGGTVRLNAWRSFLGQRCYGFSIDDVRDDRYKPTFRSLIAYSIRSGRDAYLNPFEARAKQLRWQTQVYNAYLLGLNWRAGGQWQELRDSEKTLKVMGKAADETLERTVGKIGELEAERIRLEARVGDLSAQAADFRVVPEYREVEDRVNELTFEMQEIAAQNTFESRLILRYEGQLTDEAPPSGLSVVDLFDEVHVTLPDSAIRTLGEVSEFHRKVTENRHNYLTDEITRLRRQMEQRTERLNSIEQERQASLSLLESGGALEDFTKLQMRLVEFRSELESVERRIEEIRRLRAGRTQVVRERQELEQRALTDYDERRDIWSRAVEYFSRSTEFLYGEPSDLIINVTENGYDFSTRMESSGSHGRDNMAIFSYDLSLSHLWSQRRAKPGVIVHDSEMFDPVDERQYALALKFAATHAEQHGEQYLALLNSDTLPINDFEQLGLNIDDYVRLVLTDSSDAGSLLGIRF